MKDHLGHIAYDFINKCFDGLFFHTAFFCCPARGILLNKVAEFIKSADIFFDKILVICLAPDEFMN